MQSRLCVFGEVIFSGGGAFSQGGVGTCVGGVRGLAMLVGQPFEDIFEAVSPKEDIVDGGRVYFFYGFGTFERSGAP